MDGMPLVIEFMVWGCVAKHTLGEGWEFEATGEGFFGLSVSKVLRMGMWELGLDKSIPWLTEGIGFGIDTWTSQSFLG